MLQPRAEPIIFNPLVEVHDPASKAAIIFIHGFGDSGQAVSNIAEQFQAHHKLPHVKWVFPSALENMDERDTAWYRRTPLTPRPSQRPELDDAEDEEGMIISMDYLVSLINDLISQGIPIGRIVVGGFSQGCAMALLIALTSRLEGQFAGVLALAGYLPLSRSIEQLREERGMSGQIISTPVFLGRGMQDMAVPARYFGIVEKRLQDLGFAKEDIERHDYPLLHHAISAQMLSDTCAWLERTIPELRIF